MRSIVSEMQHAATLLQNENTTCTNGNGKGSKSCTSYGVPAEGAGVAPGEGALDRRVISAAVVNCRDQGIAEP